MPSVNKYCKLLILFSITLFSNTINAQFDSTSFWVKAISQCTSLEQAVKTEESIQGFYDRNNEFITINNASIILRSAAKSNFAKKVFYELFYCFEGRLMNTKLETEFSQLVIGFEHDIEFSNPDILNQLHHYYGAFYFRLNELFYAEKYIKLFLNNKRASFPELSQENRYLNAMTIHALIYLKQNKFQESLKLLNATLDSAQAKNNKAWIGITKGNIGSVYYEQGNFEEAINYLNEDCKTSIQNNEIGSALSSYLLLKNIYRKQGNQTLYNNCLDSANQIYQIILKENKANELYYLKDGLDLNNSLAERYYLQNDYTNASLYYKLAHDLNNKINKNEKERLLKKTIQLLEVDKSLSQINELNKEISDKKQLLLFSLAFISIAVGLLIVYVAFYGKLKNANKNLQEIKTIIGQQNIDLEKLNKDKELLLSVITNDLKGIALKQHDIIKSIINKKSFETDINNLVPNLLSNSTALILSLEEISKQNQGSQKFGGIN